MNVRNAPRTPSFRYHKATGQGFVELNGRRIYLGRFDLPKTRQRYHQTIAEWIANDKQLPVDPQEITVTELAAAFWRHAEGYYVKPDGTPTSSMENVKIALKALKALYGRTRASDFGPKALRAVRQTWIDRKLSRKTVNNYTALIKCLFKWAASHEMIPGTVYHALTTVEGLRAGRSDAKETAAVKPVLKLI